MSEQTQHDVEAGHRQSQAHTSEVVDRRDDLQGNVPVKPPLAAANPRMFVLDNAKFFLTIGVVGTHLGAPFIGRNLLFTYWQAATFPFLMPVYACISGYCSSPDLGNVKKVDGVIKVIAMYILSQLFYLIVVRYVTPLCPHNLWSHILHATNGKGFTTIDNDDGASWKLHDFLSPFWLLWYLFDLCAWRVMLPFWYRLRYPLLSAVFWGPFVAVWWNCGDPWESIFGYWPLYILGVQAKQNKWSITRPELSYRTGGAFLFVSGSLLSVCVRKFYISDQAGPLNLNGEIWHYGNALKGWCDANSYACLGQRWLARFVVQFVEAATVWGCLQVVPHGNVRIITSFGERSIANYIFHPLTGFIASWMGIYGNDGGVPFAKVPHMDDWPWWGPYVLLVLIIAQSLFWMSPWIWHVVWPICDPPIHWILQPQNKAKSPKKSSNGSGGATH